MNATLVTVAAVGSAIMLGIWVRTAWEDHKHRVWVRSRVEEQAAREVALALVLCRPCKGYGWNSVAPGVARGQLCPVCNGTGKEP